MAAIDWKLLADIVAPGTLRPRAPVDPLAGETDFEELQRLSARPGPFQAMADAKLKELVNRYAEEWKQYRAETIPEDNPNWPEGAIEQAQGDWMEDRINDELDYNRLGEQRPLRDRVVKAFNPSTITGMNINKALDFASWMPSIAAAPIAAVDLADTGLQSYRSARMGRYGSALGDGAITAAGTAPSISQLLRFFK